MASASKRLKQRQLLLGVLMGMLPALVWLLSFWGYTPSQIISFALGGGFALYMLAVFGAAFMLYTQPSKWLGIGLLLGFIVSTSMLFAGVIYTAAITANAY